MPESVISAKSSIVSAKSAVSDAASGISNAVSIEAANFDKEEDDTHILNTDLRLQIELEQSPFRSKLLNIVTSNIYGNIILAIILVNAATLAIRTIDSISKRYSWYLELSESIFLGVYLADILLKILAWRKAFLKIWWNRFDLAIVLINVITWLLPAVLVLFKADSDDNGVRAVYTVLQTCRSIRTLRVLKALSYLKPLQIIVGTLLKSSKALTSIVVLMGLFLYIFSVIATTSFRIYDPDRFGSLGRSFFTLFSTLSIDSWSLIYTDNREQVPSIWLFLFVVIVFNTFILLNLFIAVIVNNLKQSRKKLKEERAKEREKKRKAKVQKELDEQQKYAVEEESDDSDDNKYTDDEAFTQLLQSGFGLDKYYPPNIPQRSKEVMSGYFMLLNTLEYNQDLYEDFAKVLDDLVDLTNDKVD